MSNTHLLLAYQRRAELENDEHLLDGYLCVVDADANVKLDKKELIGVNFAQAMSRFSEWAKQLPEARLFMLRTEQKPVPIAVELDEVQCKCLREDPVAFIKALSPPHRVVVRVSDEVHPGDVVRQSPIRAAHDTLADAFGDYVYFRRKGGKAESPFTGRWQDVVWGDSFHMLDGFGVVYEIESSGIDWMKISMANLLSLPKGKKPEETRYYLPRVWNTSGPWISHEDLRRKYEQFNKEREACLDRINQRDPSA